ncbi:MAG: methyltransferase domain-containing protein, partial [Acidobacteriota bacterium]
MGTSIIYRSRHLYAAVMRLLYGRHYGTRVKSIAQLIPEGSSVLDLCCGPGQLFDALAGKGIRYTGVDINPMFVEGLIARGAHAEVRDLRRSEPFPEAEFVVMHASLYHFLP